MTAETTASECRRKSWTVAALAGLALFLLLWLVGGFGFWRAILTGLVFVALLGLFLVWALCRGQAAGAEAAARGGAGVTPEPAAEPAARATASASPAAADAAADAAEAAEPEPAPAAAKEGGGKPRAEGRAGKTAGKTAGKAGNGSGARSSRAKGGGAAASTLDAAVAKSKGAPASGAPELLAAPRGGKADDLKRIKGIGPKLEKMLNEIGIWHFDQIAAWKAKDIAHVDALLVGFRGRITRDGWVKQARILAEGGETEFSARVGKGDVH